MNQITGYKNKVLKLNSLSLKVTAYFYRGDFDPKDKDDLEILSMNMEDLDTALQFLKDYHRPDTHKFQKDFDQRIKIIKKELTNTSK